MDNQVHKGDSLIKVIMIYKFICLAHYMAVCGWTPCLQLLQIQMSGKILIIHRVYDPDPDGYGFGFILEGRIWVNSTRICQNVLLANNISIIYDFISNDFVR